MKGYQIIIEDLNNDSPNITAGDIVYCNKQKAKEIFNNTVDSIQANQHLWIKEIAEHHPEDLKIERDSSESISFKDMFSGKQLNVYINEVTIIY